MEWEKDLFPQNVKETEKYGVCICSNIFFSIFDAGNI